MLELFKVIAIIVVVVLLIILGPGLTIFSMNTLFGLAIEFNFYTWFSTIWLGLIVGNAGINFKK